METKANHVLIGAFTLLGLALLLGFGLWAARYQTAVTWQDYEIRFEQAVTGLSIGSTVQYNGINMGTVRELYLDPDDPRQVIAVIRLQADAPVREDTVARLSLSGLTGSALIQLRGGSPDSPPLRPGPDGEPPSITAEESPLQQLVAASEDIASTASEVMLRILDFLSEENAERISKTLDNLDAFTVALSSESDLIGEIVRNAHQGSEQLTEVLEDAGQAIDDIALALASIEEHVIDILPSLSEDLSDTLRRFASLSNRIDNLIADNEQALTDFGVDGLAQFGPTMQEFRYLVRELSRLSTRFERHPARFLLGGDQPEEYNPE